MPDLPSVTLGLWVESGSRDETSEQAGISHFLEHLFFKGTERRTAARIAEDIDAVGGVLNAFTNKEYTCYYARVLAEHLDVALDLLGDTHLHSRFPADEIDRERSVILQEISDVRGHAGRSRARSVRRGVLAGTSAGATRRRLGGDGDPAAAGRLRSLPRDPLPSGSSDPGGGRTAVARSAGGSGGRYLRWPHRRLDPDLPGAPVGAAGAHGAFEGPRAGAHLPRRARHSAERPGPLRGTRADAGAGWRHELAPVPGDPRAPWQGVHRLLLPPDVPRRRLPRASTSAPARVGARGGGRRAGRVRRAGRQGVAPRGAGADEGADQGQHAAGAGDQRKPDGPAGPERDVLRA